MANDKRSHILNELDPRVPGQGIWEKIRGDVRGSDGVNALGGATGDVSAKGGGVDGVAIEVGEGVSIRSGLNDDIIVPVKL